MDLIILLYFILFNWGREMLIKLTQLKYKIRWYDTRRELISYTQMIFRIWDNFLRLQNKFV